MQRLVAVFQEWEQVVPHRASDSEELAGAPEERDKEKVLAMTVDTLSHTIAQTVRHQRLVKRCTVSHLASISGLSRQCIIDIEKGACGTRDTLTRLDNALGISCTPI